MQKNQVGCFHKSSKYLSASTLSVVTEDDSEFYEELNKKVYLLNKQKQADEKDIINKIKIKEAKEQIDNINIDLPDDIDDEKEIPESKKVPSSAKVSSQAQLLGNILKRKSKDDSSIEKKKVDLKIVDYGSSSSDDDQKISFQTKSIIYF